jgi:8-oxo-dGTP pyrophosphatase MutT (NUDIX family)
MRSRCRASPRPHAGSGVTRTRASREVSAGGVVYRVDGGRPLFLLIRDSYRNWGFPKGHLENRELPEAAALREVAEETGLGDLVVRGELATIDWHFRFRGKLIHKICHFFLMESENAATSPQREEGITACKWVPIDEALALISYANAREVLQRAAEMVGGAPAAH